MKKYSLKNDYSEGAHPKILDAMIRTNLEQQDGYGEDDYSKKASEIIKEKLNNKEAEIHFVSGGTQANLLVLSSLLESYQSIIAADSGHISVHETGAIENTGHKINTVKTKDGKLTVEMIASVLAEHTDEHMVDPKVVFISNSTEVGSIYMKKELQELSHYCKEKGLLLYLDGARLGSALTSKKNDLTLADISELVDAFYIGGTKNGALIGEAIVLNKKELQVKFRYRMKQKGALLAKGRLIGIQFLELFKDDLYFEISEHANKMAEKLSGAIKKGGFEFMVEPVSNQIFPILPNELIEKLHEKYDFYIWEKIDDKNSAIRIITSWATKNIVTEVFIEELEKYVK